MNPAEKMATLKAAYDEVLVDFNAEGIRITIERTLSFSNSTTKYGLRIERERTTAARRPGKPTPILLLVNNPDESPAAMLRTLADVFEQADIEQADT